MSWQRIRVWLLVWTPLIWLVLELVTYPKDRPLSQRPGHPAGRVLQFVDR